MYGVTQSWTRLKSLSSSSSIILVISFPPEWSNLVTICSSKDLSSIGNLFPTDIYILNLFILFLAMLGLCCCAGFSLVSASRAYSLVVTCRLLIAVASPCSGFSSCRAWALGHSSPRASVVLAQGL